MTWQPGYHHEQSWTGVDWLDSAAGGLVVDPYLVWAEATDYVDLGGRPEPKGVDLTADPERKMRVPVIIELERDPKEFIGLLQGHPGWEWIRVSPLYLDPPEHLKGARFFTAIVAREFFTELVHGELKPLIKRFELGLPMKPFGAAEARAHARLSGKKTGHLDRSSGASAAVIGIIDDGLAFAHQRFLRADGSTRIDYFWNQGYPVPSGSLMADRPGYGWEFTNASMEDLMRSARRGGLVDEDLVYREAAYGEVARHWAHGTHVMDLACGLDPGRSQRCAFAHHRRADPASEPDHPRPLVRLAGGARARRAAIHRGARGGGRAEGAAGGGELELRSHRRPARRQLDAGAGHPGAA